MFIHTIVISSLVNSLNRKQYHLIQELNYLIWLQGLYSLMQKHLQIQLELDNISQSPGFYMGQRVVVSRPSAAYIVYYRSQDSQYWHSVSGVCVVRGKVSAWDLLEMTGREIGYQCANRAEHPRR